MKVKKLIYDGICIVIGCGLAAFGIACFLLPNKLSSGGFSGIATIIYYFYHVPMGTTIVLLNIPIFIWGYFKFGKEFIMKSIISTVLYSEFIDFFEKYISFTHDNFLASIYGRFFYWFGISNCF